MSGPFRIQSSRSLAPTFGQFPVREMSQPHCDSTGHRFRFIHDHWASPSSSGELSIQKLHWVPTGASGIPQSPIHRDRTITGTGLPLEAGPQIAVAWAATGPLLGRPTTGAKNSSWGLSYFTVTDPDFSSQPPSHWME